ncbi:unnamed protein product [Closterium sp. NIES-54]
MSPFPPVLRRLKTRLHNSSHAPMNLHPNPCHPSLLYLTLTLPSSHSSPFCFCSLPSPFPLPFHHSLPNPFPPCSSISVLSPPINTLPNPSMQRILLPKPGSRGSWRDKQHISHSPLFPLPFSVLFSSRSSIPLSFSLPLPAPSPSPFPSFPLQQHQSPPRRPLTLVPTHQCNGSFPPSPAARAPGSTTSTSLRPCSPSLLYLIHTPLSYFFLFRFCFFFPPPLPFPFPSPPLPPAAASVSSPPPINTRPNPSMQRILPAKPGSRGSWRDSQHLTPPMSPLLPSSLSFTLLSSHSFPYVCVCVCMCFLLPLPSLSPLLQQHQSPPLRPSTRAPTHQCNESSPPSPAAGAPGETTSTSLRPCRPFYPPLPNPPTPPAPLPLPAAAAAG